MFGTKEGTDPVSMIKLYMFVSHKRADENFIFYMSGKLNVHNAEPASSEQMSPATDSKPGAEEEALDSRYLEGDSDVDPAILEKLAVYIARYSYDPQQHSPNENPDMELAFQAGDYLYVFGEMDDVRKYMYRYYNT